MPWEMDWRTAGLVTVPPAEPEPIPSLTPDYRAALPPRGDIAGRMAQNQEQIDTTRIKQGIINELQRQIDAGEPTNPALLAQYQEYLDFPQTPQYEPFREPMTPEQVAEIGPMERYSAPPPQEQLIQGYGDTPVETPPELTPLQRLMQLKWTPEDAYKVFHGIPSPTPEPVAEAIPSPEPTREETAMDKLIRQKEEELAIYEQRLAEGKTLQTEKLPWYDVIHGAKRLNTAPVQADYDKINELKSYIADLKQTRDEPTKLERAAGAFTSALLPFGIAQEAGWTPPPGVTIGEKITDVGAGTAGTVVSFMIPGKVAQGIIRETGVAGQLNKLAKVPKYGKNLAKATTTMLQTGTQFGIHGQLQAPATSSIGDRIQILEDSELQAALFGGVGVVGQIAGKTGQVIAYPAMFAIGHETAGAGASETDKLISGFTLVVLHATSAGMPKNLAEREAIAALQQQYGVSPEVAKDISKQIKRSEQYDRMVAKAEQQAIKTEFAKKPTGGAVIPGEIAAPEVSAEPVNPEAAALEAKRKAEGFVTEPVKLPEIVPAEEVKPIVEERPDAIQEPSAAKVDVEPAPGDGGAVARAHAEGETPAGAGKGAEPPPPERAAVPGETEAVKPVAPEPTTELPPVSFRVSTKSGYEWEKRGKQWYRVSYIMKDGFPVENREAVSLDPQKRKWLERNKIPAETPLVAEPARPAEAPPAEKPPLERPVAGDQGKGGGNVPPPAEEPVAGKGEPPPAKPPAVEPTAKSAPETLTAQLTAGTAKKPKTATFLRINGEQVLRAEDADSVKGVAVKSAEWGTKDRKGKFIPLPEQPPAKPKLVALTEQMKAKAAPSPTVAEVKAKMEKPSPVEGMTEEQFIKANWKDVGTSQEASKQRKALKFAYKQMKGDAARKSKLESAIAEAEMVIPQKEEWVPKGAEQLKVDMALKRIAKKHGVDLAELRRSVLWQAEVPPPDTELSTLERQRLAEEGKPVEPVKPTEPSPAKPLPASPERAAAQAEAVKEQEAPSRPLQPGESSVGAAAMPREARINMMMDEKGVSRKAAEQEVDKQIKAEVKLGEGPGTPLGGRIGLVTTFGTPPGKSRLKSLLQTAQRSPKLSEETKKGVSKLEPEYEQQRTKQIKDAVLKWFTEDKNSTEITSRVDEAEGMVRDPEADMDTKGAVGIALLEHYRSAKNDTASVSLIDYLDPLMRGAGRLNQAASLLNRMTGNGWIKKMNRYLADKNITLPDDVRNQIEMEFKLAAGMPDETARATAIHKTIAKVASYVPFRAGDWIDAYRYTNMLSNPQSHERNIWGNTIQAGITRPLSLLARGDFSGTGRYLVNAWKDVLSGNAFRVSKDAFNRDFTKWAESLDDPNVSIFDAIRREQGPSGKKQRVAWKTLTFIPKLLQAQDTFFGSIIEAGETARLVKKGHSASEAQEIARNLSNKYLYRDPLRAQPDKSLPSVSYALEGFADLLEKGRTHKNPYLKWPLKVTVPFLRTPIRIAQFGVEASPLGWIGKGMTKEGVAQAKFKKSYAKLSNAEQTIVNESLANSRGLATVGTAVSLMGLGAALTGNTTWGVPQDKKAKELFYASGRRPYSFMFNGEWYPMAYLGPFFLAFALPAAFRDAFIDNPASVDESTINKVGRAAAGIPKIILSQTPMSGVGGLIDALMGKIDSSMTYAVGFQGTQFVPASGLLRWVNKMVDPTYRKPVSIMETIEAGIPGLSDDLKAYTDATGVDVKRPWTDVYLPYTVGTADKDMEKRYQNRMDVLKNQMAARKAREKNKSK